MITDRLEWNALPARNDYSALAMSKIRYPAGTPRLMFKRARYLLLSLVYRKELKRMYFLFNEPPFKLLAVRHPEMLEKPITPYMFAGSTACERASMVEAHYHLMATLFPHFSKTLYLEGGINLGVYPNSSYRIQIGHHITFRREGELDVSIVDEHGLRLYSCAFSLAGTTQQQEVIIGSVQGPEPSVTNAPEIIKAMTKEAFGLRPKSLVVQLVLALAKDIGAHRVLAVKKSAHVFQAKRFSKEHRAKLHADYDELWNEFGAQEHDGNFVQLISQGHKNLEDVASHKRAMYRRRYAWLENLEQNIHVVFNGEREMALQG